MIPYIKTKFTSEQLQTLSQYIGYAVKAANQIFGTEEGQKKKAYVVNIAKEIINERLKIKITDEQLDAIIEGIVNEVKNNTY